MKAIVKSNVQRDMGLALIQADETLLPHLVGRVLVSTLPDELRYLPDGQLPSAQHEIASDERLATFFLYERVIRAAGGINALEAWATRFMVCQYAAETHSKYLVTRRYGQSAMRLCESCDNKTDGHVIPKLDDIANLNTACWVVDTVRRHFKKGMEQTVSLAELFSFSVIMGISDLLPESVVAELCRLPEPEFVSGSTKESETTQTPSAKEVMAKNLKAVKVFKVDPEVPGAFMLRPKRTRAEDSKYTRWVKTQPCCVCGARSDDPHHIIGHGQGGMGTKSHDYFTIPLCRMHHDALHDDLPAWEAEHGSQIDLLFEFMDFSYGIGAIA